MPDPNAPAPATESTAPGAPATVAASPTITPSQPENQTTDYTPDPAHLADPTWGPRLKALADRERKAHGRVGEFESKLRDLTPRWELAKTILSDPNVAKAAVARLTALGHRVPADLEALAKSASDAGTSNEPDETQQRIDAAVARARDEMRIELEKERLAETLGGGDRVKGRTLLSERYTDYLNTMDEITKSDMPGLLRIAHELSTYRASRSSAPPPPAASAPNGTAATDLGRGTAAPAPAPSGPLTADAMARMAGFGSAHEMDLALMREAEG